MSSHSSPGHSSVASGMEKVDEILGQRNFFTDGLHKIEQKTTITKRYIAIGVIGFLLAWIATGFIMSFACNAIGFLYPAYKSVKAIETVNKDDDTEWLMYWIVFATFNVVEVFSDTILSWFPSYFLAKCAFLLWCMAPISNSGSKVIYHRLIRPFVLRKTADIEKVLEAANVKGMQSVDNAAKEADNAIVSAAGHVAAESFKKSL